MVLGEFSSQTGGHLMLSELELTIQFPPGSTVLIPSTIMTHSNAKILQGETRYSFTQYAAGALFCYIDNRIQSEQAVVNDPNLASNARCRHNEARSLRWHKGFTLFPHISEYAT